jgi:hypothetical protein
MSKFGIESQIGIVETMPVGSKLLSIEFESGILDNDVEMDEIESSVVDSMNSISADPEETEVVGERKGANLF